MIQERFALMDDRTEYGSHSWRVVPLSDAQLLDVNSEDVLDGGCFRRCNTYRGGGGYDQFPLVAGRHFNEPRHHLQFVVQLYGCNLDCPYCYVTRAGVWGAFRRFTSSELVAAFERSGATVFHLMGGAPALELRYWPALLSALDASSRHGWVFHSDFMLSESPYQVSMLRSVSHSRALYAVNIKGVWADTYFTNTRKALDPDRMWANLCRMEEAGVPYYLTFTNVPQPEIDDFWERFALTLGHAVTAIRKSDAFSISLITYNALPFVDTVPWGKAR